MANSESFHMILNDGVGPTEIEIFESSPLNIKLRLKDKNPPCIIHFTYKSQKDLNVFISKNAKDPNDDNNQGSYYNVRIYKYVILI